jgi:hypothetical protein
LGLVGNVVSRQRLCNDLRGIQIPLGSHAAPVSYCCVSDCCISMQRQEAMGPLPLTATPTMWRDTLGKLGLVRAKTPRASLVHSSNPTQRHAIVPQNLWSQLRMPRS